MNFTFRPLISVVKTPERCAATVDSSDQVLAGIVLARADAELLKNKFTQLTSREIEVLEGVANGAANKQIAADLGISTKTVDKHRQNLMKKLHIHNTAGLTRYAICVGFLENILPRQTAQFGT